MAFLSQTMQGYQVPDSYYNSVRRSESGGNGQAKNPRSSATGFYQFLDGTWNELAANNPDLGLTPDGRGNAEQEERAIRRFTENNARALQNSGVGVDGGSLYAAHFLGAGGASKVLTQPDNARVEEILEPKVVQANPHLKGMTVGDFRRWSAKQGGAGGDNSPTSMSFVEGGQQVSSDDLSQMSNPYLPAPSPEEEPSRLGMWVNEKMPWLNENRSNALLAIGSGLLSGDDWASGIGGAAQNLLGLNQQNQQQAREDDQRYEDARIRDFEQRRSAQARTNQSSYDRPFNIIGEDPETGQQKVYAGSLVNGQYMVRNDDGELVPAETALNDARVGGKTDDPGVSGGAGGIPNATYVSAEGIPSFNFRRESEAKTYSYASRAITAHRDLDQLMEIVPPEQMTSLEAGLRRWASGNAESSLSASVLNSVLDDAGFSGTTKSAMAQYLQAVLRDDTGAAYTGVEIADYASAFLPRVGEDPQTLDYKRQRRLSTIGAMVAKTGDAAPYLTGVMEGQYELPYSGFDFSQTGNTEEAAQGGTNQSQPVPAPQPTPAPQTSSPPSSFDGDPADWAYLTPEQQALWADDSKGALDSSNVAEPQRNAAGYTQEEWDNLPPEEQQRILIQGR